MFDFSKFQPSAYKNKYEIALDLDKKRLTYGEVYDKANALCNSFINMDIGQNVYILSRCVKTVVITALALSKCDKTRIFCDEKIPKSVLSSLVQNYPPDLVIAQSGELERVAEIFKNAGVKKAVCVGKCEQYFPAQFEFDALIDKNDYLLVKEFSPSSKSVFQFNFSDQKSPVQLPQNTNGFLLDIPVFCSFGAQTISSLLYDGKRVVSLSEKTPKTIKKHRLQAVLTTTDGIRNFKDLPLEPIEFSLPLPKTSGSFFDKQKAQRILSEKTGEKVTVCFNGAVFVVTLYLSGDQDISDINSHPVVIKARECALDILYPFTNKKLITVKKGK